MIVTRYAIRFRKAVFVALALLLFAGMDAYRSLPREQFPDITIPHVFITAPYPGTAPEEVEKLIAIPLERKLNEVEGIKAMKSTSGENLCFMDVEFVAGTDLNIARQRVKDKVDLARPELPADLDEPVVDGRNFSSDVPILIFAISGDSDLQRLKHLAEQVKDMIERLPEVREVDVSGGREREIRIEPDAVRMAAHRLTVAELMRHIADENVTVSAGNLEVGGDKFLVRLPGEFATAAEMAGLPVAERNGRPVFLRDVATVTDDFKDLDSRSRVNGEPCVSLSVKKRDGVNVVDTIRRIDALIEAHPLPPGLRRTVVFDQAEEIQTQIQELENNIFSGFLLVVLILLLFLGVRNSVLVGMAIPASLLLAFILMRAFGATLNTMTLFSLVLVIGMLVDNAIVIVENTFRLRGEGLSRMEAADRGAREVAWPVLTSTATTLAAFLPLMFWPGIIGNFMWYLPWTVIVTLLASLLVALLINPAVCSIFIERRRGAAPGGASRMLAGYERLLRGSLHHVGPVLALGFLALLFSFLLYARFDRGVELFPTVDPRSADIFIRFPQGTPLERVDAAARAVEEALPETDDIEFVLTNIGVGAGTDPFLGGVESGTHRASFKIQFVDFSRRSKSSMDWIEDIRVRMPMLPGAEVVVSRERMGPPVGAPVQVEVSGDDFEALADLSAEIRRALEGIPGLVDLRSDFEDALPEIRFELDRPRAALYGLDANTVGLFLRMSIFGLEASTFRAGRDEYDITLRLPESQRDSFDLLASARIPTPSGAVVPLTSVGSIRYAGGRGEIQRKNQKRVITLTGNEQGRGLDQVLADVQTAIDQVPLPSGYGLALTGENQEQNEAAAFLTRAFLIASGLILMILVIQFNSPVLPLIIYTSVLLSLIGVMGGLLATGARFSVIMTGLGVISLAGVVVNNAIVLIDCINQHKLAGLSTEEAVVQAGRQRLRPVLLTAVTTILGLIPMAAGWGLEIHEWPWRLTAGAESSLWWRPMAVAVIFGLAMATLLTLVLVPAMYSLVDRWAAAARRRFHTED